MKWFLSLFSSTADASSKRFFGGVGLLVIFFCYAFASVVGCQLPSVTEFLAGACVTLLSVDPITNVFKKDNNDD